VDSAIFLANLDECSHIHNLTSHIVTDLERERENFICKAGTPKGQPPIYAGTYATVHNNAQLKERKKTTCIHRVS